MANLSDLVVDQYGALTYKKQFESNARTLLAITWVPEEHQRRLRAYTVLTSYLKNMSRFLLNSEKAQNNRREYGDAELIVQTIVAAVLGEETVIMVDDAGDTDEDKPVNADADRIQEWFDTWNDDEKPLLAIHEGEEDAVGLGDGLYEVSYDAVKRRPRITVYEPGFYFPVLDTMEQANNDFPTRVHVAWDYEKWVTTADGRRQTRKFVRRITWEMVPAPAPYALSWNTEPAVFTCLKTDATWLWDDLGERRADDFDLSRADIAMVEDADGNLVEVDGLDLGIDYLPVVHLPNTPSRKEHFGESSLALVLQILDDLQGADTDLALASRLVGTPPLAAKDGFKAKATENEDGTKTERKVTAWGPGQLFDGEVVVLDTSKALDALLKYIENLLHRLTTNAQLSDAALGRTDPAQVEAGVILALSFGPMARMIQKMRMVRDEKYPLLMKMVLRTAIKYELIEGIQNPAELPAVHLAFGRFLPQDRQGVVTMVTTLLEKKAISRLTAIKMLMEDAGLPIEDAAAEVERIEHSDFEGAVQLADASDDVNTAREYLGIDPIEEPEEPEPPAQPPPGAPVPAAGVPPINLPPTSEAP